MASTRDRCRGMLLGLCAGDRNGGGPAGMPQRILDQKLGKLVADARGTCRLCFLHALLLYSQPSQIGGGVVSRRWSRCILPSGFGCDGWSVLQAAEFGYWHGA